MSWVPQDDQSEKNTPEKVKLSKGQKKKMVKKLKDEKNELENMA